jgi:hypothetical protein
MNTKIIRPRNEQNENNYNHLMELQYLRSNIKYNKLREIKQSTLPCPKQIKWTTKEEMIINCLRISHSHIIYGHLMAEEVQPILQI